MNTKSLLLMTSILTLTSGCSSTRLLDESASVKIDNVIFARGDRIKTKDKLFNLEFQVGNLSAETLHFGRKGVRCGKGGIQGIVRKFQAGKIEYVDFNIEANKNLNFILSCTFNQKNIPGDYYVELGTIYKGNDADEATEKNTISTQFALKIKDPDSATE
jgi:hypothetical protein